MRGLLTTTDIAYRLADGADPFATTAGPYAHDGTVTVDIHDSAATVAQTIADNHIGRVLVAAGNRVVGIVCEADLARGLPADEFTELMQPVVADPYTPGLPAPEHHDGPPRPFFSYYLHRLSGGRLGQTSAQ